MLLSSASVQEQIESLTDTIANRSNLLPVSLPQQLIWRRRMWTGENPPGYDCSHPRYESDLSDGGMERGRPSDPAGQARRQQALG
jgi:hypothetical protein